MKKKICVITGTRAEYGLLKPLMDEIKSSKELELQIVATGAHLSPEFGLTYKRIENDGFIIDEKLEILMSSDSSVGITKSMGLVLLGMGEVLLRLNPDLIVLLGDRYEIFCCAAAATVCCIPIAHLHGGEITEGAMDEAFRHSITKMSHLHFTSTEECRQRVIQLGENPENVFNVGAIGIDNIKNLNLLTKKQLEHDTGIKFGRHNYLITFHPVTLEKNSAEIQFKNLLTVLETLDDSCFIFTKANADTDGRIINHLIDEFVKNNSDKSIAFTSMGQLNYLSAMQYVDAVVGNSSSGIIETPSFKIGTINVGDRQKGRIRAGSIIDCKAEHDDIMNAFKKLHSSDFQKQIESIQNPYGDGSTSKKIIDNIKVNINRKLLKKSFVTIANQ